jgi:hypothetical protein
MESKLNRCSFCGNHKDVVKKLIVGENVAICNECVDLCSKLMVEDDVNNVPKLEPQYDAIAIKKYLDDHVIGQEKAKQVLSVAIANHYKRITYPPKDLEIQKGNVLIIGPTGTGKTHLAKTVAKYLGVPFVVADATSLTEAGYVGDDVESMIQMLLNASGGDQKLAEKGIIFLDECFPPDTEILTENGFIRFDSLNDEKVAQYHPNGSIDFITPLTKIKKQFNSNLFRIETDRWSHTSTPNHNRVLLQKDNTIIKKAAIDSYSEHYKFPIAGTYSCDEYPISDDLLKFMVAFAADGNIKNKIYGYISVKKDRKKERLDSILESIDIKYSKNDQLREGYTSYYLGRTDSFGFPSIVKDFKLISLEFLLRLSLRQRLLFLEELTFWDGHVNPDGAWQYTSSNYSDVLAIQTIAHISGMSASIMARKKDGYRDNYLLHMKNKTVRTQQRNKTSMIPYEGLVYCVEVHNLTWWSYS